MISAQERKIRPVAQISPFGSFVPLVNLVVVATPSPPMTGAERRCCGSAVPPKFHQPTFARRLHFCKFSGRSFCVLRKWAVL